MIDILVITGIIYAITGTVVNIAVGTRYILALYHSRGILKGTLRDNKNLTKIIEYKTNRIDELEAKLKHLEGNTKLNIQTKEPVTMQDLIDKAMKEYKG